MAISRQSRNSTHKWKQSLLHILLLESILGACARNVWSDQAERFRIERQAVFFDKKTEVVERNARDLNQEQLEALTQLRWLDKGLCSEDVSFFYTLTIYDRSGKENIFHAPDWNCGLDEGKRYIKEEPLYKLFRALTQ